MAAVQSSDTRQTSVNPLSETQPPNIDILPNHDARSVSLENIPLWQKHYWTRVSKEVTTKLPPAPEQVSAVPQTPISEIMADSDGESSSESDEALDDPLSTNTTAEKTNKSRFPVNLDLNGRISLWYVFPSNLNACLKCLPFRCLNRYQHVTELRLTAKFRFALFRSVLLSFFCFVGWETQLS